MFLNACSGAKKYQVVRDGCGGQRWSFESNDDTKICVWWFRVLIAKAEYTNICWNTKKQANSSNSKWCKHCFFNAKMQHIWTIKKTIECCCDCEIRTTRPAFNTNTSPACKNKVEKAKRNRENESAPLTRTCKHNITRHMEIKQKTKTSKQQNTRQIRHAPRILWTYHN